MAIPEHRTFRKAASTRAQSAITALLITVVMCALGLPAERPLVPLLALAALLVLSLAYVVFAFGDRYALSNDSLCYYNTWLLRCGYRRERKLLLDEIASVREHRRQTLVLRDHGGRAFVIDAVDGYIELRDYILHWRGQQKGAQASQDGPMVV